jgi:hypothetical protein
MKPSSSVVSHKHLERCSRLLPGCFVARRRHSAAMTPTRALPAAKIHRTFLQLTRETSHQESPV